MWRGSWFVGASSVAQSIQTLPTQPDDFAGTNTTAEIAVHPSGRFVYASNRGHHSMAMFAVLPQARGDWSCPSCRLTIHAAASAMSAAT